MKLLFTASLILFSYLVFSQACPVISSSSIQLVSSNGTSCTYTLTFNFTNPSSGVKSINATVTSNNIVLLNQCFDATHPGTVTSNQFTSDCSAMQVVTYTSYTGTNCGGSTCSSITLPVKFFDEKLRFQNNQLCLSWKVAEEDNVNRYIIEYSNKDNLFTEVGQVAASKAITNLYQSCLKTAAPGAYRVKAVDMDGKLTYSRTLYFTAKNADKLVAYPIPTESVLQISNLSLGNKYYIIDKYGKLVQSAALTSTSINVGTLAPGIYLLKVAGNDNSNQLSFIKL